MRCSGLDRLLVLHHRLDRERHVRSGKPLVLGLFSGDYRDRKVVAQKFLIHTVHQSRFIKRLSRSLVRGVALLPQKLRRTKKHPRPHFPTHHIGPLIDQQRQVAIRLDPTRERRTNDRLGSRANHIRLGQLAGRDHSRLTRRLILYRLQAVMRHHRALGRKSLGVLSFLFEIRKRNQQREIRVLVTGLFETHIQLTLDQFPNSIAPWLDHHAPTRLGILREVRGSDHLLVPLGKILSTGRTDGIFIGGHVGCRIGTTKPGKSHQKKRVISGWGFDSPKLLCQLVRTLSPKPAHERKHTTDSKTFHSDRTTQADRTTETNRGSQLCGAGRDAAEDRSARERCHTRGHRTQNRSSRKCCHASGRGAEDRSACQLSHTCRRGPSSRRPDTHRTPSSGWLARRTRCTSAHYSSSPNRPSHRTRRANDQSCTWWRPQAGKHRADPPPGHRATPSTRRSRSRRAQAQGDRCGRNRTRRGGGNRNQQRCSHDSRRCWTRRRHRGAGHATDGRQRLDQRGRQRERGPVVTSPPLLITHHHGHSHHQHRSHTGRPLFRIRRRQFAHRTLTHEVRETTRSIAARP